jgi:hypothetical protein
METNGPDPVFVNVILITEIGRIVIIRPFFVRRTLTGSKALLHRSTAEASRKDEKKGQG